MCRAVLARRLPQVRWGLRWGERVVPRRSGSRRRLPPPTRLQRPRELVAPLTSRSRPVLCRVKDALTMVVPAATSPLDPFPAASLPSAACGEALSVSPCRGRHQCLRHTRGELMAPRDGPAEAGRVGRSPGVCWCPRGASPSCCPPCSCSDPGSVTSGGRGAGTQDELTVAMTTRSYHHQPGALAVVFPPQSCPGTQDVVAVGDTGAAPARVTGRGWLLPVLCGTNGSRNSAPSARSLCWEVGSCSRQGTLKLSGVSPAP